MSLTRLRLLSMILSLLILVQFCYTSLAIHLDTDGGYTDIVVKVSNSVPEDHCPKILANIKVIFKTFLLLLKNGPFPVYFLFLSFHFLQ